MTDNLKVSLFIDKNMTIVSCEMLDTIARAKTLMILNDFSQIPILADGKIQGCISWKSIGKIEAIKYERDARTSGGVNCKKKPVRGEQVSLV